MENKKGFTLVELLVVVAILAILSIGVIPNIFDKYIYAKKEMFLSSSKALIKESKNTYSNDILKGITNDHYSSTDNKISGLDEGYDYCISFNENGSIKSAIIYNNDYYVISFSFDELLSFSIDDLKEYDEELIKDCVNAVKVTFDFNDDSAEKQIKILKYKEKYGDLPTKERNHYNQLKWYTSLEENATEITKDSIVENGKNHTLYAKWSYESYKITLNANGGEIPSSSNWTGSGNSATKKITYNNQYGELPEPTRIGYTFEGWYTEVTGGTKVNSNDLVKVTDNQTLYAHWLAKKYVVTLDNTLLPSEYTELSYVQFTRGSITSGYYIDLGFTPVSNTTGFQIDFIPTVVANDHTIMGTRRTWDSRAFYFTTHNGGALSLAAGNLSGVEYCAYYHSSYDSGFETTGLSLSAGTRYKFTYNKNGSNRTLTGSNGVSKQYGSKSSNPPGSMILGALRLSNNEYQSCQVNTPQIYAGIREFGSFKLYRLRYFSSAVVTRDYFPAKNSAGTIGIYDMKNSKFYTATHQGSSGSFSGGSEVNQTTNINVTYGSSLPSVSNNAKTGYTLKGYYTQKDCGGTKYYNGNGTSAKNYDFDSNITLYACWEMSTDDI